MPVEPGAAIGTGPGAIRLLVDIVRQQATLLSGDGPQPDDPLLYAWLSCLEATTRVGRAIEVGDSAREELEEALSATRGAASTVRFLLFGRNDQSQRASGRPRDADAA